MSETEGTELIGGKFETQEDLLTAYQELEKKVGQTPEPGAWRQGLQELLQDGQFTDETKAAEIAQQAGISLDDIRTFQAGVQAQAAAKEQELLQRVGGQEQFQKVLEWAGENVSKEDLAAYNEAVGGNDPQEAELAILRLQAHYTASNGAQSAEPARPIQGRPTSAPAVQPFSTPAEMDAAMDDPRYLTDQAFRAEVEAKLAAKQ